MVFVNQRIPAESSGRRNAMLIPFKDIIRLIPAEDKQ